MERSIRLHYGERSVKVALPQKQILTILDPRKVNRSPNEIRETERALNSLTIRL